MFSDALHCNITWTLQNITYHKNNIITISLRSGDAVILCVMLTNVREAWIELDDFIVIALL